MGDAETSPLSIIVGSIAKIHAPDVGESVEHSVRQVVSEGRVYDVTISLTDRGPAPNTP